MVFYIVMNVRMVLNIKKFRGRVFIWNLCFEWGICVIVLDVCVWGVIRCFGSDGVIYILVVIVFIFYGKD